MTCEEVSAEVLRHLLRLAQRAVSEDGTGTGDGTEGDRITCAVVAVPAHFGPEQRAATAAAARRAGIEVRSASLVSRMLLCGVGC